MGREELVNWFSLGEVESNLSPADLLTEEEVNRLLDACLNHRDKAMIALLYESAARIGELLSMRVKDVQFDEYGAVIWLPRSKTKRRKLRVVYSVPYLSMWLSVHLLRDNPEAALFISLGFILTFSDIPGR